MEYGPAAADGAQDADGADPAGGHGDGIGAEDDQVGPLPGAEAPLLPFLELRVSGVKGKQAHRLGGGERLPGFKTFPGHAALQGVQHIRGADRGVRGAGNLDPRFHQGPVGVSPPDPLRAEARGKPVFLGVNKERLGGNDQAQPGNIPDQGRVKDGGMLEAVAVIFLRELL